MLVQMLDRCCFCMRNSWRTEYGYEWAWQLVGVVNENTISRKTPSLGNSACTNIGSRVKRAQQHSVQLKGIYTTSGDIRL